MSFTASKKGRIVAVKPQSGPEHIDMSTVTKIAPKAQPEPGTVHWLNDCIERGKSGVFSEIASLNPGLANVIEQRNPDNRSIRQTKVEQYASDMRSGRWAFNGEPIIISDEGLLNDGQHRIRALMDANICLPFLFVFGLPRETRLTLDQGSARSASDYLGMDGVENASTAASIARQLLAFEVSDAKALPTKGVTNAEVLERTHSDPGIKEAAHYAVTVGRHGAQYVAATTIGLCFYLFAEIDEHDAKEFLAQVSKGVDLKPGSPALAVRERLLAVGKSRQAKAAVLFRGWNFFRRGMKVKANSLTAVTPFPALI